MSLWTAMDLSVPAAGGDARKLSLARNNRSKCAMRRDAARCDREPRAGNSQAIEALDVAGRAIGVATASLSQIFFPDRIALAGGLAEAGDLVLAPALEEFRRTVNAEARAQVEIVKASLGWRATVIGGALGQENQPPMNADQRR